ncbi:MAG: hypothetical protein HZA54_02265 [Planctomycetes bacterium]|nr:hypothetical protein [Planctomycetota bacterium]
MIAGTNAGQATGASESGTAGKPATETARAGRITPAAGLAAVVSAVLLALAFPPVDAGWLAWFALVPLLLTLERTQPASAFMLWFAAGMLLVGLSLHWFHDIFGPLALILCALVAAFYGIYGALAAAGVRRFGTSFLLWGAPALWVVCEHFRSELWPLRFAWLGLGYSQHAQPGLLQAAAVAGVYGLSFLVVLANAALAVGWRTGTPRRRLATAVGVVVALAAGEGLGRQRVGTAEAPLAVACVQGEGLGLAGFRRAIQRTAGLRPDARLFVLPEYTTFSLVSPGQGPLAGFAALANNLGVHILFGGKQACTGEGAYRNTAFLVAPDGRVGTQAQSQPIQFFDDGLPAERRVPLTTPWGPVGVLICYDLDFPGFARELVQGGAELLLAPTMDVREWGETQHAQHFAMPPLRAVETGRFVVRCASSGISGIFDPFGRVVGRLDGGADGDSLVGMVGFRSNRTLYLSGGWVFPWLCWMVAVAAAGWAVVRRARGGGATPGRTRGSAPTAAGRSATNPAAPTDRG